MRTIRESLEEGSHTLKKSGVDSYRIDARLLLAKALGYSIEEVIIKYDEEIDAGSRSRFLDFISRRARKEPLSYLTGVKEFYGMDFAVDKNVLIPRPDSEVLVEGVLNSFNSDDEIEILELGVGSGCLLLSILKHMNKASGVGVDIQRGAVDIAKRNYQNLKLGNKAEFISEDWNNFKMDRKFDLIISNPPYITSKDILDLQEDVREYEPNAALEAGEDGLDAYRSLAPVLKKHLKENGLIFLEFGEGQNRGVQDIMLGYGFSVERVIQDLSGKDRCIVLRLILEQN